MPERPDSSHVVIDYSQAPTRFRCQHCGAEHVLKLPAPIDRVSKWCDGFTKLHEDCSPRQVQP